MCEFCTQHGEGKVWYLEMKNYADELFHAELSTDEKAIVQANTRYEWNQRFWKTFVMPAITGQAHPPDIGTSFHAHSLEESKIEHFGQVLPIEDVEQVIERVDSITRIPCGCRFLTTGLTDKRYCFGFGVDKWGILGDFPNTAASLETLDKQEAKRIFRAFDDEGLVHSIWSGVTPYVIGLCNCDHDCGAMRGWSEYGAGDFFRAEYVCQVNWDQCTGCKTCMSQCQFGAQYYSSALSRVYISPKKCFGCGVCRAACPNNAIDLIQRRSVPEAAELWA
jgi:ferredoxin